MFRFPGMDEMYSNCQVNESTTDVQNHNYGSFSL